MIKPCPTCNNAHDPANECREAMPLIEQLAASLADLNCMRCGSHVLAHGYISTVCPDGQALFSSADDEHGILDEMRWCPSGTDDDEDIRFIQDIRAGIRRS